MRTELVRVYKEIGSAPGDSVVTGATVLALCFLLTYYMFESICDKLIKRNLLQLTFALVKFVQLRDMLKVQLKTKNY